MLKIGRPVHSIIGKRKDEDAKTLMEVMTNRKYTQEKIQTTEKNTNRKNIKHVPLTMQLILLIMT